MSSTIKNILLGLVLIGIVALGYFTFFAQDDDELLSSGVSRAEQAELESQQLLKQLQDLQQIKIDQSIFADPRFMSLQDFRQQLPEEPSGRENPFAPTP